MALISVFLGGGLGSLARYGLGMLFPYREGFPWATFCANICAAFVLGMVLGWLAKQDAGGSAQVRWFLATGFCGGFSTFSTFSSETLMLIRQQQWTLAAVYVLCSLLFSILLLGLGIYFGKQCFS
jgi:fluoride exporter